MNDATFAYELSKRLHAGQKYGDKDYFHHHILGVLGILQHELGVQEEGTHIVALCHDNCEDTNMTYKTLCGLFKWDIADDILMLTNDLGKARYQEYIDIIDRYGSQRARVVKIADVTFNYRESIREGGKWLDNAERYRKVILQLATEKQLYDLGFVEWIGGSDA